MQRDGKHRKDWSEEYQGQELIPASKQVLAFLWSMANQEPTRLVTDRFNITMSSVDRVLHRGTQALADLSTEYIKWPNGTCFFSFLTLVFPLDYSFRPLLLSSMLLMLLL